MTVLGDDSDCAEGCGRPEDGADIVGIGHLVEDQQHGGLAGGGDQIAKPDLFERLDLAFVNDLQAAVPVAGSITFSSGAYGYPPDEFKYPPSHWVPYARAAYMKTVAGAPIQYADNRDNLKRRIFDPGFYLDLVPITVSYFTWLLIAIEPAFRATGYERKRLTEIRANSRIS